MKNRTMFVTILVALLASGCTIKTSYNPDNNTKTEIIDIPPQIKPDSDSKKYTITKNRVLRFRVIGQGVSPTNTISPAQAIALAKRAAIADAYRQLGERISGVQVEGRDKIDNMVVNSSSIRTYINALIKNAKIVDVRSKDGLYEVEMEVVMDGKKLYPLCD
jgi:hypothetical protein